MTFRVTATLGRPRLDRDELMHDAQLLDRALTGSHEVVVDPVKAAIQLISILDGHDAVTAAMHAMGGIVTAFQRAQLDLPLNILHVEAEAVPPAAEGNSIPQAVE